MTEDRNTEELRDTVRNRYASIARQGCCDVHTAGDKSCCCGDSGTREGSCREEQQPCCGGGSSCCGQPLTEEQAYAMEIGYSDEDLATVPEAANMGLGCGNPQAIANMKPGEVVLDLGSGGGLDCFLAAQRVGPEGRVIGVDMTPEMISRARKNISMSGTKNVEFRLGEIEHLPVSDNSVDVIISNCVINLSPDKQQVFREAYRVLKSGGRLAISDIVATSPIPEELRNDSQLWCGCISGAQQIVDLEKILREIGFQEIQIIAKEESREFIENWIPDKTIGDYVVSALIQAVKP